MRSATLLLGVPFLVLATGLVACAPAEEENADEAGQNLAGGSGSVESPTVLLFEASAPTGTQAGAQGSAALPKCAGALVAAKVAVTAKSCAKQGMVVGRAADKDGKGTRATIRAVHVPEGADADIAVIEIDKEIGGTHAVLTHAPLREGYTVSSFAAVDGNGFFSPERGEAASVGGRLVSETELHSTLFPNKGTEICSSDVGAPVCSSTSAKIFGYELRGTCGLSGLVIGPEASTPAAAGTTTTPTTGGTAATAPTCSGNGWKVAQLGRYADFIRRFAPEAFQPIKVRLLPDVVPQGLWGYKTGGNVASCKIETTTLAPLEVGKDAKVTAKVTFSALQQRSAPVGRIGIAPKGAPTQMRWLASRLTPGTRNGTSLTATFEGIVSAAEVGDYIIGFRTSANGGEAWTQCDVDGIDNGFEVDKLLSLQVVTQVPPQGTTPPAGGGTTPPSTSPPASETTTQSEPPAATPPSAEADSYDDSASYDSSYDDSVGDTDSEDEGDLPVGKKKKKSSESCSASPVGTAGTSGLPLLGVLLGLAAVARRRR